jgi:hypothetical protein
VYGPFAVYATADCQDVVELPSKARHGGDVEVVADAVTFAVVVAVNGVVTMFVGSAHTREFQYGFEAGHTVHAFVTAFQYGVAIDVATIHVWQTLVVLFHDGVDKTGHG